MIGSVLVHAACVGLFVLLVSQRALWQRTAVIGVVLVLVLTGADVALALATLTPVLRRFLRWTLYFQATAPLALVYALLVAARGGLDPLAVTFGALLVLPPALHLAVLSVRGLAAFLLAADEQHGDGLDDAPPDLPPAYTRVLEAYGAGDT